MPTTDFHLRPARVTVAGIAAAVNRMDSFQCDCDMIAETHRKGDCSPMWHAGSWHDRPAAPVATARA